MPRAAFTVTKLTWLARHEPDVAAAVRSVLLPHDYLTFRLTGRMVTDRGDASGTGYFDPSTGSWRTGLLDEFVGPADWADRLPRVLGPTEPAGPPAGASGTGLASVEVVGPGTGDNMAAALGLGLAPGQVCVSIGTSGTVHAPAGRPPSDPTGTVAGFADATGGYLPLVCTLNATRVTDAVARLLGVDAPGFDRLALDASTGTLAGIRSVATRSDLARAAVEGVVCGLLDALDALEATVATDGGALVLVGGGARSTAYRRVLADLSGRTVVVAAGGEAVATGAAVQAAAVLTGRPLAEVQRAWGLGAGTPVEPDGSVDAAGVRQAYAALRG